MRLLQREPAAVAMATTLGWHKICHAQRLTWCIRKAPLSSNMCSFEATMHVIMISACTESDHRGLGAVIVPGPAMLLVLRM